VSGIITQLIAILSEHNLEKLNDSLQIVKRQDVILQSIAPQPTIYWAIAPLTITLELTNQSICWTVSSLITNLKLSSLQTKQSQLTFPVSGC
jgi:hypothetical protein